jgi:hypothetical protein
MLDLSFVDRRGEVDLRHNLKLKAMRIGTLRLFVQPTLETKAFLDNVDNVNGIGEHFTFVECSR